MPVLDRLRRFYEEHTSDDDALRAARALLVTGVADPADWRRAKGDPVEFMRRMLSRWVAQGYGDMRKHPGTILTLHLSPETDRWYVGMWVDRVHQVPLGAMVRLLEQYHPRLPATVVRIFNEAVWKVGYAFGASEYEEYAYNDVENELDEQRDALSESDYNRRFEELCQERLRETIPPAMSRRPLSLRAVCRLAPAGSLAAELVDRVLQLRELAKPLHQDENEIEQVQEALGSGDWDQPWPLFLTTFEPDDDIRGAYDWFEHAKFHSGWDDPPSYAVPIDIDEPASLIRLRDRVVQLCRFLGHTMEFVTRVPVLDVEPVRVRA